MIYLLENPGPVADATTDFLPKGSHKVGGAPRCPACSRFVGMLEWLPPFQVELQTWGAKFGDIAFGPGESLLVSERLASIWQAKALVGLEGFEDVKIVNVRRHAKIDERRLPRYFRVSVARSDVAVDSGQSGIEWGKPPTCDVCRVGDDLKGWERIVLEATPLENVFMARGLPGQVIVDEQFRSFCEENRISNVRLTAGLDAAHRFRD